MQDYSYEYVNKDALLNFLSLNSISPNDNIIVKLIGLADDKKHKEIIDELYNFSPKIQIVSLYNEIYTKTFIYLSVLPSGTIVKQRSSAIDSVEQQFNSFDQGPVIIFKRIMFEDCWAISSVTNNVKELWGYENSFFTDHSDSMKQIILKEDFQKIFAKVKYLLENGKNEYKLEYRVFDNDGNIRWVDDYTRVYRDVNGEPIALTGYLLDKTDVKEEEKKLNYYLDQIVDIIFVFDGSGNILDCNEQALRILNYSKNELTKLNIEDISDLKNSKKHLFMKLFKSLKVGIPTTIDTSFISKDESIPIEMRVSSMHGHKDFYIAICRDMSDKVNSQNIIKQNEELYRGIINTTTEGFWLLSNSFKILDVNYSLSTMLGYTKDEMLGKSPYDFMKDEFHDICHDQEELSKKSAQRVYEMVFTTKSNKEIHVLANATNIYESDGSTKTFAFMTDISKQKEIENSLILRQKEIEELNTNLEHKIEIQVAASRDKDQMMYQQSRLASMGEMIGNIAHQWRQPLNILALVLQDIYISGQLGTLSDEKLEKEYDKANDVLQYMSQTIDDFRNFFKNTSNKDEVFDLKVSIESVYKLIETNFKHNRSDCIIEIEDSILVKGSQNEFKQVIINILNNAQDAIKSNKVKNGFVKVKAITDETSAKIIITDNGGGIEQTILNKIFDPYFTTKHQTQGTGLGLYMSKQIVEQSMNGSLQASNSSDGAMFEIILKVVK